MLPSALPETEKENARSQGNKPAGDCGAGEGKAYELRQIESDGVHRESEVRVMDKVKQAFIDCEKFIDEHTPEELREYEKSLNLDYESYRTPEQVAEDLVSITDSPTKGLKKAFEETRHGDMHYDTAGNLHYTGSESGGVKAVKHIIPPNAETIEQSQQNRLRDRIGEIITVLDENRQEREHIMKARRELHGVDDDIAEYNSGMAAAFDLAIIWLERALDDEK